MRICFSPVKRFGGQVTLPETYTFGQVMAWEQALDAASEAGGKGYAAWHALLPGIIACVDKWELTGVPEQPTPETFPFTPLVSANKLMAWLMGEVQAQIAAGDELPNA